MRDLRVMYENKTLIDNQGLYLALSLQAWSAQIPYKTNE